MSRSPAHLTAAAVTVRAVAAALTADFAGLGRHTGRATWEGPAATAHRRRTAAATGDAHDVAAELQRLADRLDDRAAALVAADTAAARRQTERLTAAAAPPPAGGRSDG